MQVSNFEDEVPENTARASITMDKRIPCMRVSIIRGPQRTHLPRTRRCMRERRIRCSLMEVVGD